MFLKYHLTFRHTLFLIALNPKTITSFILQNPFHSPQLEAVGKHLLWNVPFVIFSTCKENVPFDSQIKMDDMNASEKYSQKKPHWHRPLVAGCCTGHIFCPSNVTRQEKNQNKNWKCLKNGFLILGSSNHIFLIRLFPNKLHDAVKREGKALTLHLMWCLDGNSITRLHHLIACATQTKHRRAASGLRIFWLLFCTDTENWDKVHLHVC